MPLPDALETINRPSMRDEVYKNILNFIMDGILLPGEKIRDKELAERLGVSRTPVREALRKLEDKELIESSANRWTRVAKISLDDSKNFYPIIWALEELAISQVIDKLSEEDLNLMTSINDSLQRFIDEDNAIKASWADVEFHKVFIEKTKNNHLISILNDLKLKYRRVEVYFFTEEQKSASSTSEHTLLIEALRSQNEKEAKKIIRNNWEKSLKRLQQLSDDKSKNARLSQ